MFSPKCVVAVICSVDEAYKKKTCIATKPSEKIQVQFLKFYILRDDGLREG